MVSFLPWRWGFSLSLALLWLAETAVWTTLDVSGELSTGVTLTVEEELRFADVAGPSLARQHTDIGISWDIDGISALGGYRNTSSGEHRPYVGVGLAIIEWYFEFG